MGGSPTQIAHPSAEPDGLLARLLSDDARFRSSDDVGRQLVTPTSISDFKALATEARMAKRIIGVWDGEKYRYPAFQFNDTGQPLPDISALVAVLPRDSDGSNRPAALWLFAPTLALGSRAPAEVFQEYPVRVIALARKSLEGGPG